MGNGDGIVPPQGMNVIERRDTLYGLPLGIPTGGGGTKVTTKLPMSLKAGSGMQIKITNGTYTPAVRPPINTDPHTLKTGSGVVVRILTVDVTKIPMGGGGTKIQIVIPVYIRNGGGMKSAKT